MDSVKGSGFDELLNHSDSAGAFRPCGTLVCGRYVVMQCLGMGSVSIVYKCHHKEFPEHPLVLKVLHPAYLEDDVLKARFEQEASSSTAVDHPNVIRTYEFIKDGSTMAYTMEYADNGDLRDLLKRTKMLGIQDVVWVMTQVCAGLQAIHDAGFVHRDIKPDNIFFTRAGNVKVADFGVVYNEHRRALTQPGQMLGTMNYISPEYLLDGVFDHRSDIYALGILAYEALTGQFPFDTSSPFGALRERVERSPVPPHKLRPDCILRLSAIVLKAMAQVPEDRYQSAADMMIDLEQLNADVYASCLLDQQNFSKPFVEGSRSRPKARIPVYGQVERLGRTPFSEMVRPLIHVIGVLIFGLIVGYAIVVAWSNEATPTEDFIDLVNDQQKPSSLTVDW